MIARRNNPSTRLLCRHLLLLQAQADFATTVHMQCKLASSVRNSGKKIETTTAWQQKEGIMRGEIDNINQGNNKNKLQENTDEDERALELLALMQLLINFPINDENQYLCIWRVDKLTTLSTAPEWVARSRMLLSETRFPSTKQVRQFVRRTPNLQQMTSGYDNLPVI